MQSPSLTGCTGDSVPYLPESLFSGPSTLGFEGLNPAAWQAQTRADNTHSSCADRHRGPFDRLPASINNSTWLHFTWRQERSPTATGSLPTGDQGTPLRRAGVHIAVCGQAVADHDCQNGRIGKRVTPALSTLATVSELQRKGCALKPP